MIVKEGEKVRVRGKRKRQWIKTDREERTNVKLRIGKDWKRG